MNFNDILDISYIKLEKQVSLKLRCDIISFMISNTFYVVHNDIMDQLETDINER